MCYVATEYVVKAAFDTDVENQERYIVFVGIWSPLPLYAVMARV